MWRTLLAAVVLVGAVAGGVVASPDDESVRRSELATALAGVPAHTLTTSFTSWAGVRSALDADDASSRTNTADQAALFEKARIDDLTAVSVLVGSAEQMAAPYGFNVLDLQWETLAQSREGAAIVVRLDDDVDLDALTGRLDELGYVRPSTGAVDGAVWVGGADLVAGIEVTLTPLLSHIAVIADRRILVMSEAEDYARVVSTVVTSGEGSLLDSGGVAETATPLLGSVLAVLHTGQRACATTSYARASVLDRRDARAVAASAGGLVAYEHLGFGVGRTDDGYRLDVSMAFADPATAAAQREVRAGLATGPAIGQGGTYEERFEVTSSTVSDRVATLELSPVRDRMDLVSDLTGGPLMFAWCGR